eukprot:3148530-Amphidinium_carterae.1
MLRFGFAILYVSANTIAFTNTPSHSLSYELLSYFGKAKAPCAKDTIHVVFLKQHKATLSAFKTQKEKDDFIKNWAIGLQEKAIAIQHSQTTTARNEAGPTLCMSDTLQASR